MLLWFGSLPLITLLGEFLCYVAFGKGGGRERKESERGFIYITQDNYAITVYFSAAVSNQRERDGEEGSEGNKIEKAAK